MRIGASGAGAAEGEPRSRRFSLRRAEGLAPKRETRRHEAADEGDRSRIKPFDSRFDSAFDSSFDLTNNILI